MALGNQAIRQHCRRVIWDKEYKKLRKRIDWVSNRQIVNSMLYLL
jgi:hypothetical protein